jgi:hypothetical protein
MKTLNEMRSLVREEKTKLLTIDAALNLKGKKIQTIYFGYRGQDGIDEFVVGEIISELEFYETQPCEGYASRADYWKSYMSPNQLSAKQTNYLLLTEKGDNTHIFCDNGAVFCCTDSDRFVHYILCDNEN